MWKNKMQGGGHGGGEREGGEVVREDEPKEDC